MVAFDSEKLRTFAAVIEHGTLDGAARALHITAPAVSLRLKSLEQSVGRVLLQRSSPVQPTEAGETVLRLARQLAMLEDEAARELQLDDNPGVRTIPIAVNADSLAIWFMAAVRRIARELDVMVELLRDDEHFSSAQLRAGTVVAAIVADDLKVQGARSDPLGIMRYLPVASPRWVERWMPEGIDLRRLQGAPAVDYDRKDQHQERFVRTRLKQALDAPRHWIPSSHEYAAAVRSGLGWGLVPEPQCAADIARGRLIELTPGKPYDVTLYWHRQKIESGPLARISEIVAEESARALRPVR
ncbi:ArgP/LysG family DNA-binding transcriptional regulator [Epidermidibacterium keratini]|uniref:ArgP/LysG family DNA-binding transcriptional regulator n=1 Tax=Epidermidibacterium keratini TaxID=1891644 RepID=A0A7L4YQ06_9ACTN|nr:LysR family transcriptional regulator ArgP [Epidermidibacterium keratini]QHC01102.1 ArgP/LysG family DNA-binding transcriptional regulator [Epidermidibacterium keratini]